MAVAINVEEIERFFNQNHPNFPCMRFMMVFRDGRESIFSILCLPLDLDGGLPVADSQVLREIPVDIV